MSGFESADGFFDGPVQFIHIVGAVVAQRVTFEVIPSVFIGIQFGRIGRQEFGVQARMPIEKISNLLPPMGVQTIPDQKHMPAQMSQQLPKERDDLFLTNGAIGMKVQVPTQPATTRRDRDGSNPRKVTMMTGARSQNRRLTSRSPRSPHHGTQENARFIDKYQPGPQSACFFLIRGQSRSIQRRTASSSRSRA